MVKPKVRRNMVLIIGADQYIAGFFEVALIREEVESAQGHNLCAGRYKTRRPSIMVTTSLIISSI